VRYETPKYITIHVNKRVEKMIKKIEILFSLSFLAVKNKIIEKIIIINGTKKFVMSVSIKKIIDNL
jgi:hypothetical protein